MAEGKIVTVFNIILPWSCAESVVCLQVGTTSGDVTFIDVSGLKANTPYHFRVTASNVVGSGPPYAPEEAITAGKMMSKFKASIFVLYCRKKLSKFLLASRIEILDHRQLFGNAYLIFECV